MGDAAGIAGALALAGGGGDALAQEDSQKQLEELNAELELFKNPQSDEDVRTIQKRLRGAGLYDGPIDAWWGGGTREAAKQYVPQLESKIEEAQQSIASQNKQQAYLSTRPSEGQQLLREAGPIAAGVGGLGLGLLARYGMTRIPAMMTNKLLSRAAVRMMPGRGKAARAAVMEENAGRAANINEFWRRGGAGEQVPFKTPQEGLFARNRPRGGVADPSALFQPSKKLSQFLPDAGVVTLGGGEAATMELWLQDARKKLEEAEEAVRLDPNEGNYRALESAIDQVKALESAQRAGLGLAAGHLGAMKLFSPRRPNVAGAERERMLLNQFLSR
jgi:hypothetical protein